MVHALQRMGVPVTALQPLGWRDMEVTKRLRDDLAGSVAAIRAAMAAFRPSLLCVPALRDSHPDHGAVHVLCRLALAGQELAPLLLSYAVHGATGTCADALSPAASPARQQRKLAALAEYRSQLALSRRRMLRLANSPERYMRVHGQAQGGRLPWRPPALLRPRLRLLLATPAGVRDWLWPEAPLERENAGTWRLRQAGAGPAFVKLHLDWRSPWIFDHWGWWQA